MGNTPSGPIYKSPTAQITHTKKWRLMEVESLNWSYFFVFSIFAPITFITMAHYLFHLYKYTCDFFIFSLFSSSNVHFPMLRVY